VRVGGIPVLARVHAALTAVPVDGIWVAGPADGLPDNLRADVHEVHEEPRFAGPLAGIAAAVADMPPEPRAVVLVLAGDVPYTDPADLSQIARTCAQTGRAVASAAPHGRRQHLCAAWPDALLRARLAAIGDPADRPVRLLWEGVDPVRVAVSAASLEDFDTEDDLRRITGGCRPDG
jgi:molybdopterin-guanine dinucleotide biosynthesis protein A